MDYNCTMVVPAPERGPVMKKAKWIPPVLTVLAREHPEKHVLAARIEKNAPGAHQPRETKVKLHSAYALPEAIVARDMGGVFVIVPVASGTGAAFDALCTLNDTGRALWESPDGKKTLKDVVDEFSAKYDAPPAVIEKDILGFAEELLTRYMLVESVLK